MSSTSTFSRSKKYSKFAEMDSHNEFLSRISKTLYYKKFPRNEGLSLPITELAAEIFTEVKNGRSLDRLDVEEASHISRQACVSPCSFVLALLYIDRLKDCNPEYLQKVAPSELFLVTLMVASKFLLDDGEEDEVFNSEWAQSGQISTAKMNRLEMEFLHAINWTVFVNNNDFWERLKKLERDVAFKEAKKRGWFSYTDLEVLLNFKQLESLINTVIGVSSLCLATYAAGLMTLLGSILLVHCVPDSVLECTSLNKKISDPVSNVVEYLPTENLYTEFEEEIEEILLKHQTLTEENKLCNKSCVKHNTHQFNNSRVLEEKYFRTDPNYYSSSRKKRYEKNNFFITNIDYLSDSDRSINSINNHRGVMENIQKLSEKFYFPKWVDHIDIPFLAINKRR